MRNATHGRARSGLLASRPIAAPLAIVLGFLAGAYIAECARTALTRPLQPLECRYFLVAALFGGAALMPAQLVLYGLFPDWTLMYLANPAHLSGLLVVPVLALASAGAPALGFVARHDALGAREAWRRRAVWIGPGALAAIVVLFGGGRLATVAYYDAFHAGGRGVSLFRSELFLPLMLTTGAVVSVYVYAVLHIRRHVELGRGLPVSR